MLKKSSLRRIIIASLTLLILLLIYFFPTKNRFKEHLSYIPNPKIPIYLIDKNNYTIRTTINQNNNNQNEVIKNII